MKIEQEAREYMETKQKETSDELTPEDREAFRFYYKILINTFSDELHQLDFNAMDAAVELVKEEKRRLNVS